MNINICYENKNNKFKVDPLESILSIKSRFFSNNNNLNEYDIFLDNKKLEDHDYLDKFTIINSQKLHIYAKKKGGNKLKFLYYFIGGIIVFLPIIILSVGFIPAFSSMLGIILQKSFGKIFDYLECNLGKKTLVSRFKWLTMSVVQYLILGLIIYIIITIPLTILCTMLKGQSIFENPLNLCKPVKTANSASTILILIYFLIYFMLRYGNWIGSIILDICKKSYLTDTLFSPIIRSLLNLYDKIKYMPFIIIPFIGSSINGYIKGIQLLLPLFYTLLVSIKNAGCKKLLNKTKFLDSLKNNMLNTVKDGLSTAKKGLSTAEKIPSSDKLKMSGGAEDNNKDIQKNENIFITLENQKNLNKDREELKSDSVLLDKCKDDNKSSCCNNENMVIIGDTLKEILDFPATNMLVKKINLYFIFVLLIEAFYEQAINKSSSNEELKEGDIPDKKIYLKKILNERSNALTPKVKDLITKYLYETNRFDDNVDIKKIFNMINIDISKENFGNAKSIKDIKYKLQNLDNEALDYAKLTGSNYQVGGSFIKIILRNILIDGVCNIFNTTNSSTNIIESMGAIQNVSDMMCSGVTAGTLLSIIYVITVVVLIIMRIFGLF